MKDLLHQIAHAHVARLAAEVERLRLAEVREVQACTAAKQPPGHGYWEDRHAAEERLRCAKALFAALDGSS